MNAVSECIEFDAATAALLNSQQCFDVNSIGQIQEFIIRAYNWHNERQSSVLFKPLETTYTFDFQMPMVEALKLEQNFLNSCMKYDFRYLPENTKVYIEYDMIKNSYPEQVNELLEIYVEEQHPKTNKSVKPKFFSLPSNEQFQKIYNDVFHLNSTNQITLMGQFGAIRLVSKLIRKYREIYRADPSTDQLMDVYLGTLIS